MSEYAHIESPEQAKVTGTRVGLVEDYAKAIAALGQTVSELSERLSPVLAPEYGEPSNAESAPAPVLSSGRELLGQLGAQERRLRTLLERLEV